jgi:prophage tail gpP-like protein
MTWLDLMPCFCPAADVNKTKETAIAKLNECRNAGFSYTVTCAGVRCGNGLVWQINENCSVFDPDMKNDGTHLYVNSRNISFSKDGGTISTIGMSMVNAK